MRHRSGTHRCRFVRLSRGTARQRSRRNCDTRPGSGHVKAFAVWFWAAAFDRFASAPTGLHLGNECRTRRMLRPSTPKTSNPRCPGLRRRASRPQEPYWFPGGSAAHLAESNRLFQRCVTWRVPSATLLFGKAKRYCVSLVKGAIERPGLAKSTTNQELRRTLASTCQTATSQCLSVIAFRDSTMTAMVARYGTRHL